MTSLAPYFGPRECALFWPGDNPAPIVVNADYAMQRISPASTFKVLNALIALERGVIAIDEEIPYDGTPVWNEEWRRSYTIGSAFRASAVWFFQRLARRIGRSDYQYYLRECEFGNGDCGGPIDSFWLDGSLCISPYEQLLFMRRFVSNALPLRDAVISAVKDMMLLPSALPGRLRGKTGWATGGVASAGWFVGYFEDGKVCTTLTVRIDMPDISRAGERQTLVERCLLDLV